MRANQIFDADDQDSNASTVMSPRIEKFFDDVAKASSKNPIKQEKYLALLHQLYFDFEPMIAKLSMSTDQLNSTLNAFTEHFVSLMKQLQKKATPALMFTALIGTVTAQKDLIISKGQAPGGTDLCSGVLNCIQGFITDNLNKDFLVSFNAFLDLTNKVNGGAVWAFNDCITVENVGNLIKNILLQNATLDVTTACSANINKAITTVGSQVHDLALEQCLSYQNAFTAETQRCLSDGRIIGLNWAIAGIILGIIICCAVTASSVYCCYKNKH